MRAIRRAVWVVVAAALVVLGSTQAAGARIVHAETVLPPGESGFVSPTGVTNGTGSPHLYDQQSLFTAFQRKDAQLSHGGQTEEPKAGVRIVRDSYGVPAIYAGNDPGAWWGTGYATAQDRLFELELFRRATTGHLAEILGKSYLSADIATRRDFYTPAEIDTMLGLLPADLQARYQAYLGGINAYVSKVQQDPTLLPGEFVATGDVLKPFTLEDLGAIGVFLARTTPNGDGSELDNANALRQLGSGRFNAILPLRIAGQVSTIPPSEGLFPSVPGRTSADEQAALTRSSALVAGLPLPTGDQASGSPGAGSNGLPGPLGSIPLPIHVGGSSTVAVGDPRHHRSFLFSGPELGFSAPEELYEIEVHRPGLDARGITAPGAPVIAIGHNAHVGWGVTSGLSQTNSLYAERLVPGQSEQYVFNGRTQTMSCRDETFTYRSAPTDILAGRVPQVGQQTERLCRTAHGPVQARAGGVAYARRYATWGREAQTITGLDQLDEAANIHAVDRAAAKLTWNENLMAADDQGNIGYWHPGLLPIDSRNWDERLPLPGTGEAEWQGLLPVSQRPHVINPKRGWLTNWNNIPSQGWTTGNDPASERVGGPFFRTAFLNQLVKRLMVNRPPSFAALQQVVMLEGTTAEQRSLATPGLARASSGASGPAATVLATILHWDGSYARTDARGSVDPGVAAWQAFKDAAQGIAVGRLGPGADIIGGGEPNSEHVFDVSLGQAYALRVLSAADYGGAAADAYGKLVKQFGSSDPSSWRSPRAMFNQSSLGAEQPPPLPFFDRGTWEQLLQLQTPAPSAARRPGPRHGHHRTPRHRLRRHVRARFTG